MRAKRALIFLLALSAAAPAAAQQAIMQGGPWAPGHAPMYVGQGFTQPIVQDGGGSAGGGVGATLSEIGITARSNTNTYPSANSGNGPLGEHHCIYDGPTTNATGYHYLCMDPNAAGGGLIDSGFAGGASALPFNFKINGVTYPFPFNVGGILGPGTTVVGDVACWNNGVGTLLSDCGAPTGKVLGLLPGTGAAAGNLALLNAAIVAANATTGVPAEIILPAGDFYFGTGSIVPLSYATLRASGRTTLHYTGSGSAVENNMSVLLSFGWKGIQLDAANASYGVKLHSAYASYFDFGGQIYQTNAAGTFLDVLADVTTGPQNPNGNYNAAFNKFTRGIMNGAGQYTGTLVFLGGAGNNSTFTGAVTLNTFDEFTSLDTRAVGLNFGHWSDSNTFTGTWNIVMNAANSTCIWFNSSGDTTGSVYNEVLYHFNCDQYATFPNTTAILMGATTDINIYGFYIDGLLFGSQLTIDPTYTGSYFIHTTNNNNLAQSAVWQRYVNYSDGTTQGLTKNLPIQWTQIWNNSAVPFTAYDFAVTDTGSASGSTLARFDYNGTTKASIDKTGALSLAGGISTTAINAPSAVSTQALFINSQFLTSAAPTIASGFGTSPSIAAGSNGPGSFDIIVGSGGTASAGQLTMPTPAANGWNCYFNDVTTFSSSVFLTKGTGDNTTTVIVGGYNSSATLSPWNAGDHIHASCFPR